MRRDDLVSLTVAINLPVWRETKRDPRVAEAIAMRDQAIDMYQAQQNETVFEAAPAGGQRRAKPEIGAAVRDAASCRKRGLRVESSLAAYRVNRVDFLTLLDSQMTVLNYEVSYAAALANYNKALAEIDLLDRQAGTLAPGERHEVDLRLQIVSDRRGGRRLRHGYWWGASKPMQRRRRARARRRSDGPRRHARFSTTAIRWACPTPRRCRRRIRWAWTTSRSTKARNLPRTGRR